MSAAAGGPRTTPAWRLRCVDCAREHPALEVRYRCECGGTLDVVHDFGAAPGPLSPATLDARRGSFTPADRSGVWRFREWVLPLAAEHLVTRAEGNTHLYESTALGAWAGLERPLRLKHEGENPTGSFKDRGMTVAITVAKRLGMTSVACASTGNTAASAAAYAARAGMKSIVLIPQGKVAAGKLAGAVAYGAQVIQIDGSFDDALTMVIEITNKHPICLVNSINPYRIEGQKSSAFEICDVLEAAPDWLCLPVGNAGNITAYWAGFKQYDQLKSTGLPQVLGVQAAGAAPLVLGHPVEKPETVATAIRIGKPARGEQALQAAEESKGRIIAATDQQILDMQKSAISSL